MSSTPRTRARTRAAATADAPASDVEVEVSLDARRRSSKKSSHSSRRQTPLGGTLNPTGYNLVDRSPTPSTKEILAAIPSRCFVRSTPLSMFYAVLSVAMTLGLGLAARALIPTCPIDALRPALWFAYACAQGTVATGMWVVAHECGHGAFSDSKVLQDAVGYVLHSLLLVPYFSWQRSHAVHHSRTNHLTEGETHCPPVKGKTLGGHLVDAHRFLLGELGVGVYQLVTHLLLGWPLYLLAGATGGPSRGVTNHFVPWSDALFPGFRWKYKVLVSDVGVAATLYLLKLWADATSWREVGLLYFGPYLGVNFWLVLYTWLQHTDVDVPHLDASEWTWERGAFLTIDRPYGPVLDFLHHRIGSTHAAHHLCSRIPHYRAEEATRAIAAAFPDHYLRDPTPVGTALWRVATKCAEVSEAKGRGADGNERRLWMFVDPERKTA